MIRRLKWGIIGTGHIAGVFAESLAESTTSDLMAIGSRRQEKADRFGNEFDVERRYSSYDDLLADPDVDIVYITTPHAMHAEWATKAAEAGKHILCEKPLAMNYAQAEKVIESARTHDVFLAEAFMYRCHHQTTKIIQLIREQAIGDVRVIRATFSFYGNRDFGGRVLNPELGGGGILDVGCYPVSMCRLIAGVAIGRDFAEPVEFSACGHIGDISGVDEYAVAIAKFPGEILAQLTRGIQVEQRNSVEIFGTDGTLLVPEPWQPGRWKKPSFLYLRRRGERDVQEIVIESDRGLWTVEAETMAEHIEKRRPIPPAMTWEDTLGNMRMLDLWREYVGMVYPFEKQHADGDGGSVTEFLSKVALGSL